jgi:acyl-CoA thioesterase I
MMNMGRWMRRSVPVILTLGLLGGVIACDAPRETASPVAEPPQPPPPIAARPAEHSTRPRIVALGDSLTAGLGLMAEEAYPAVLQRRLDEKGYSFEVVNAGVSGDTTAGGLRRLDWSLEGDVRILIVALGGNDGLRGLPVDDLKRNLSEIIRKAQSRHIAVLLMGIEAPPNFGDSYTGAFRQAFRDVARQYKVPFVPFLLAGVAGISELNQRDGIHPTAEGARIVAGTIWSVLEPMLGVARPS